MTGLRNLGIDDETPTPRNRKLVVSTSSVHDEKTASVKVSDALLQAIRPEYRVSLSDRDVHHEITARRTATLPLSKPVGANGVPSLVSDESVMVPAARSLERTAIMQDTLVRRSREEARRLQSDALAAANGYPATTVTFAEDETPLEVPMASGRRTGVAIALGLLAAAAIGAGFAALQLQGLV